MVSSNRKEDKAEELRRAAQNPVADLISFPIQNNTNFKVGPLEKTQEVTNLQPVVPFHLSENWLLISRTIAPIIYQPEFVRGQGSEFGLGDINQALFFAPRKPGSFLWCAGPAAVGLTMRGPWVFGALVQNIWSFAGDSKRDDINQFLLQYFVNYNLPRGWYLTSAPIIRANWEADSDNTRTVPFGGGVGRLFRIGKLPVNTQLSAFHNVEKPDNVGPDWTLRFQMQFLFPKSLK